MGKTISSICERPKSGILSENKKDSPPPAVMLKDRNASLHSEFTYRSDSREWKISHPLLCKIPTADLVGAHTGGVFSPTSTDICTPCTSVSDFDWADSRNNLLGSKGKTREEIGMRKLKAMQACGISVKQFTTHGGRSALMFAVLSQDLDFVKVLVADGADAMEKNEHGETALALSKSLPSQEIYDFLLESTA